MLGFTASSMPDALNRTKHFFPTNDWSVNQNNGTEVNHKHDSSICLTQYLNI